MQLEMTNHKVIRDSETRLNCKYNYTVSGGLLSSLDFGHKSVLMPHEDIAHVEKISCLAGLATLGGGRAPRHQPPHMQLALFHLALRAEVAFQCVNKKKETKNTSIVPCSRRTIPASGRPSDYLVAARYACSNKLG